MKSCVGTKKNEAGLLDPAPKTAVTIWLEVESYAHLNVTGRIELLAENTE